MKKPFPFDLPILQACCLALFLCASGVLSAERVKAVATTTMVSDLVNQVGGEYVEVVGLMGPSVDPHLYKASIADINHMRRADVIFYNGLHLEGRMTDVLEKLARGGRAVYAISDAIPDELLLSPEGFEGYHDPHIWLDPRLWAVAVDVVERGLIKADPDNAQTYSAQAQQVRVQLNDLHQWALGRVAELPEDARILITSHDAYNYFGRSYGFDVVGVQGISTTSEAGLADIAQMVDFIKKHDIKALFVESSVSPAAIERISEDTGAVIGGELFSDAMGIPGELHTGPDGEAYDVGTYIGMFKHNMNTIVEALK